MAKTRELPKVFELTDHIKGLVGNSSVPEPHIRYSRSKQTGMLFYSLSWVSNEKLIVLNYYVGPQGLYYGGGSWMYDTTRASLDDKDLGKAFSWLSDPDTNDFHEYLRKEYLNQ